MFLVSRLARRRILIGELLQRDILPRNQSGLLEILLELNATSSYR